MLGLVDRWIWSGFQRDNAICGFGLSPECACSDPPSEAELSVVRPSMTQSPQVVLTGNRPLATASNPVTGKPGRGGVLESEHSTRAISDPLMVDWAT